MGNSHGFIIIRTNQYLHGMGICKFSKCLNLDDTDKCFRIFEIKRGSFALIFKIDKKKLDVIYQALYNACIGYMVTNDSGVFFSEKIISLIPIYLDKMNIPFSYKASNYEYKRIKEITYSQVILKEYDWNTPIHHIE